MDDPSEREQPTLPSGNPTPATIPSSTGAAPLPVIAGYEVLGEIAQGGMGVVYKARQVALDRVVALKVMIAGEHATAEQLERFHREAKAAARLEHPNIVQVYDVGQEGARHWFTMRYVEGEPLSRLIRREEVTPRRAMETALKVALALAYAHDRGVIHRDVKPSNILVDTAGEPHLADFGLVKDLSSGGLTAPGATLGTPAYASPEQVEGDLARVGARSDVYSLGATLYEMLTGRPPFSADSIISLIAKVMYEEPTPPRWANPRVQADIETICLRAMEKEPERRYASAGEMAADIERYLEGAAITARPISWISKQTRRARIHRAGVVASILLIVLAALVILRVQGEASKRQMRASAQMRDARNAEAEGRAAADRASRKEAFTKARLLLVGIRKLEPDRDDAKEAMKRVEGELVRIEAEEKAERDAAASEAASAEQAVNKAHLVSKVLSRWGRLIETVRKLEAVFYDSRKRVEEKRQQANELWPPVDAFMKETPDDPTSQATMLALAGWARCLAARQDEGNAWMQKSETLDAEVPYGALMQALVDFCDYTERQALPTIVFGRTGIQLGLPPAETAEMTRDREQMGTLLDRARKARVWGKEGAEEIASAMEGVSVVKEGKYKQAEKALTAALASTELRPFENGLLFARATERYVLKDFRGGKEDLEKVVLARPGLWKAWDYLGRLEYAEAMDTAWRGTDPRPLLEKAILHHSEAARLDPQQAEPYNNRAVAEQDVAETEASRGIDPRDTLRKALDDYGEVLKRQPHAAQAWTNHGGVWRQIGEANAARGIDPTEDYRRAIRDQTQAATEDPSYALAYFGRGNAWESLGKVESEKGLDPREEYAKSAADFDRALSLQPDFSEVYNNRGNVRTSLGKARQARGEDARDDFRKAISDYDEALARMPESPDVFHNRGFAHVLLAGAEDARGVDPRTEIEKGIADYGRALGKNANDAATYSNRGNAWIALGSAQGQRGIDPRDALGKAIEDFGKALKINPEFADAYNNRGNAEEELAEAEENSHIDARERFEKAIADFGESLKRDPGDPGTLNNRGNAYMKYGQARTMHQEDPSEAWKSALADFDALLAKNPRLWQGHANRGLLFELMEKPAEAVKEYQEALSIVGDNAPELKKWLSRAKEKLSKQ